MSVPAVVPRSQSEDLPTARPADRPVRPDVRASWNGPVDATPCALVCCPLPSARPPCRARESPHVTIAPADPASAVSPVPTDEDGPGTALLRLLAELTADLPDADPGRVAAAALRGRSARADEAELRE